MGPVHDPCIDGGRARGKINGNDVLRGVFPDLGYAEIFDIFHCNIINQATFMQISDGICNGCGNGFSQYTRV